jgi:hypothetical protein
MIRHKRTTRRFKDRAFGLACLNGMAREPILAGGQANPAFFHITHYFYFGKFDNYGFSRPSKDSSLLVYSL